MEYPPDVGKCFMTLLDILWAAGCPRPGSAGSHVSYVVRVDTEGTVLGADIYISDKLLGELTDKCD
jgi:hypothetical protein